MTRQTCLEPCSHFLCAFCKVHLTEFERAITQACNPCRLLQWCEHAGPETDYLGVARDVYRLSDGRYVWSAWARTIQISPEDP